MSGGEKGVGGGIYICKRGKLGGGNEPGGGEKGIAGGGKRGQVGREIRQWMSRKWNE